VKTKTNRTNATECNRRSTDKIDTKCGCITQRKPYGRGGRWKAARVVRVNRRLQMSKTNQSKGSRRRYDTQQLHATHTPQIPHDMKRCDAMRCGYAIRYAAICCAVRSDRLRFLCPFVLCTHCLLLLRSEVIRNVKRFTDLFGRFTFNH